MDSDVSGMVYIKIRNDVCFSSPGLCDSCNAV